MRLSATRSQLDLNHGKHHQILSGEDGTPIFIGEWQRGIGAIPTAKLSSISVRVSATEQVLLSNFCSRVL